MKPALIAGLAILLALDWAAFDDITTGSEPSFNYLLFRKHNHHKYINW